MNFSFVHIADIHLGRPFSGLSKFSCDENASKIYKKAVERAFENAIGFACSKNVDFVFIAGDTFDSSESDFSSKLILKNALKKLLDSNISVFLIAGNHDPITAYNKNTFNFGENSKVKIIGLNTPISAKLPLYNKANKLVGYVHALSFSEEKFTSNPLEYFSQADEKLFDVGLLHCDLNADLTSPYAPCSLTELNSLGYDYWALGHIHIPTNTDDNVQYAGTLQGRNTKEIGEHGFRYVKVENNRIIKNSFVPCDVVRYVDLDIDLSSVDSEIDAVGLIEDEINSIVNKEQNLCDMYLLQLKLSGCITFYSQINETFFETVSEHITTNSIKKIYISQIENNLSPKVDEELIKKDDGISGELYKLISDDDIIKNTYIEVLAQLKNVKVNVDDVDSIVNDVKEAGMNLCNLIYNDTKEE